MNLGPSGLGYLHPTRGLPAMHIDLLAKDILTEILRPCSPSTSDQPRQAPSPRTAPLLLCHVCSYWRRLTFAIPKLWWCLNLGEVRPTTVKRGSTNSPPTRSSGSGSQRNATHLSVSTLKLQSISKFIVDVICPHELRSLTLKASKYRREDVKTEWERKTRGWVVERGPNDFQLTSVKQLVDSVLSLDGHAVSHGVRLQLQAI